jgi:deoxycytidylate deaminase
VYYKAKTIAMNNGQPYHLACILKRGKSMLRIGTNSYKTHPRFGRKFKSGPKEVFTLHAEMDVLRFAQPGDDIIVLRFRADGSLAMAKPCIDCQKIIEEESIRRVYYSNSDGDIIRMNLG